MGRLATVLGLLAAIASVAMPSAALAADPKLGPELGRVVVNARDVGRKNELPSVVAGQKLLVAVTSTITVQSDGPDTAVSYDGMYCFDGRSADSSCRSPRFAPGVHFFKQTRRSDADENYPQSFAQLVGTPESDVGYRGDHVYVAAYTPDVDGPIKVATTVNYGDANCTCTGAITISLHLPLVSELGLRGHYDWKPPGDGSLIRRTFDLKGRMRIGTDEEALNIATPRATAVLHNIREGKDDLVVLKAVDVPHRLIRVGDKAAVKLLMAVTQSSVPGCKRGAGANVIMANGGVGTVKRDLLSIKFLGKRCRKLDAIMTRTKGVTAMSIKFTFGS
jgi:hypothetical protein